MKKINKILIYLPNLQGGGAEKVYTNLANYWTSKNIEVIFMLNKKTGPFINQLNKKIRIIDLNINRIRKSFFAIPPVLREEKPDIFLSAMWPLTSITILIKKIFFLKTKLIVSDHVNLTESIQKETNFNYTLFKYIVMFTYKFSDGIICVSKGVKKNIIEISRVDSEKIHVIYNPLILEDNSKILNKQKIRTKLNKIRFLSVGTLKVQKNHAMLIEAFSMISKRYNVELMILGDGPEKNNLKNLIIKNNQINRIFIKDFDIDVKKYYLQSSCFILSSNWEGFGNVIVEALHYGLKIISTNCKYGPSEILENGKYGSLIEVGDVKSLYREMLKFIESENFLFSKENYEKSLQFSVKKISNQYLDYFKKII